MGLIPTLVATANIDLGPGGVAKRDCSQLFSYNSFGCTFMVFVPLEAEFYQLSSDKIGILMYQVVRP